MKAALSAGLESAVEAGQVTPEEARLVRGWHRDGRIVAPNARAAAVAGEVLAAAGLEFEVALALDAREPAAQRGPERPRKRRSARKRPQTPRQPRSRDRRDKAKPEPAKKAHRTPQPPKRARISVVDQSFTRQPAAATALLTPIEVEAVSVDGIPAASRHLRPRKVYRRSEQLALVGPRTLAGTDFDPLLAAAAEIEHPTVRADVLDLARFSYALARPMTADLDTWTRLLLRKPVGVKLDNRR